MGEVSGLDNTELFSVFRSCPPFCFLFFFFTATGGSGMEAPCVKVDRPREHVCALKERICVIGIWLILQELLLIS